MKKIFSMLTIAVRSSFYKICVLLTGMSILEFGMFYYTYRKYEYSSESYLLNDKIQAEMPGSAYGVTWTLESLIEKSRVELVFLTIFVLLCLILLWAQSERRGVRSHYFYQRMGIGTKERFLAWSLYNIGCIWLLITVQVLAVLGMGAIFVYLVPVEYESVQMYFMAFYKSEFLHSAYSAPTGS